MKLRGSSAVACEALALGNGMAPVVRHVVERAVGAFCGEVTPQAVPRGEDGGTRFNLVAGDVSLPRTGRWEPGGRGVAAFAVHRPHTIDMGQDSRKGRTLASFLGGLRPVQLRAWTKQDALVYLEKALSFTVRRDRGGEILMIIEATWPDDRLPAAGDMFEVEFIGDGWCGGSRAREPTRNNRASVKQ